MFTPPGYRKKLLADLARWTETGMVSRATADTIAAEYRTDAVHAVLAVLAVVFAILAAGGLIALVAANWNEIPREIRFAGLLAINLVALGACLAFRLERQPGSIAIECAAVLSAISAAATIALVGQMYHLPSNWPGFGLAMMCIAGATALAARSTACLWLAAAAQLGYLAAIEAERSGRGRLVDFAAGPAQWTSEQWIILGFAILLIALAMSRWTVRSGPWTIFVTVSPLFWWIDDFALLPTAIGLSLALTVCGIVATSVLAHELRHGERAAAAASALIGVFAIGAAALVQQVPPWGSAALSGSIGLMPIAAAVALALAAAVRRYADRGAVWWLAAATAAPFVGDRLAPAGADDLVSLGGIFRLVLVVVLPLGLLAVEARLSERRKTFAFAVTAIIAIVCFAVGGSRNLLSLGWVLLGGSVLIGAVILLARFLSPRPPAAAREGAS